MNGGAHAGHGHGEGPREHLDEANQRRVFWALLLTGGFMLIEFAGGLISGSLALLADAGHMLTDTAALGLTWHAFRISRRPATPERSYGHARSQVIAAFANGAALIGIALWILIEAGERLLQPVEIIAPAMLAVAAAGLLVNLIAYFILSRGGHDNLNIRGAILHILGDLLGSAGAIVAAVVILLTGWTPIDPLLSVLVAILILHSAWRLVGRSWHVLMESAPEGLDVPELRRSLAEAVPGVLDIHHVHAWSLVPGRPLMTLHATIASAADHDEVLHAIQQALRDRFGVEHATIQVECERCTDEQVPGSPGRSN